MKRFLLSILLFNCLEISAQTPPALAWQRSFGGSDWDVIVSMEQLPDGGYIMAGSTKSNDGDITASHGLHDAWVIKTDARGIIQWQATYGGSQNDVATAIKRTVDGGYIFTGSTRSNDGQVSGNHGGLGDVWVVKLNSLGGIEWQKCFGGPGHDLGSDIQLTADGGYIIGGQNNLIGGDVTVNRGGSDIWLIKISSTGILQWEKSYGGSLPESIGSLIVTLDGNYFVTGLIPISDGNISCSRVQGTQDGWVAKVDNSGNIIWQDCFGGNASDPLMDVIQTSDGGFLAVGITYSSDLPGAMGSGDALVIKWNANGNMQWYKLFGGSGFDDLHSVIQLADGSYLIAGATASSDGDICSIKGDSDFFLLNINASGVIRWTKTFGGSASDRAVELLLTNDGGYLLSGSTLSNDGDVSGYHGTYDGWVIKLTFPGVPLLPTIVISASDTTICPGKSVTFIARTTDEGSAPTFQWMVNGLPFGGNSDTVTINTLSDGDVVTSRLTSNSRCVTNPVANSNSIRITVDNSSTPRGFLPNTIEICSYGEVELKPSGTYKTYLWNTNATTPSIVVNKAGTYQLQVTNDIDCPGSDTIVVTPKDCLKGFYMPNAFTPNNDGKNDVLKPILAGRVIKYEFNVFNRWGQKVFQTSDVSKGWNGTLTELKQDSFIFIWTCTYQFSGEAVQTAKGTVFLMR